MDAETAQGRSWVAVIFTLGLSLSFARVVSSHSETIDRTASARFLVTEQFLGKQMRDVFGYSKIFQKVFRESHPIRLEILCFYLVVNRKDETEWCYQTE